MILQCSVTPPPPEGVTYRWTDSIPSTYLSSTQNLTLTIPAHHPSQGHYYCTVYNGSLVFAVGSTTIRVRGELDIPAVCYCSFHVLIQACMPLYVTVNDKAHMDEGHSGLWCTNHIEELTTITSYSRSCTCQFPASFSLAKHLTYEGRFIACCLDCKTSFCGRHVTLHCVCGEDMWWVTVYPSTFLFHMQLNKACCEPYYSVKQTFQLLCSTSTFLLCE